MVFLQRNSAILAFLILALITAVALHAVVVQGNDALYRGQLQQCHFTNLISAESNSRGQAGKVSTAILKDFLESARDARLAAFHHSHQQTDEIAARSYAELVKHLDTDVKFHSTPLINCAKVIPKP